MRGRSIAFFLLSAVVLLAVVIGGYPGQAASSGASHQPRQGRYFKWAAPPDWRVSETNSGVTLTSPDGRLSASLATLLRSRGTRTPEEFLRWVFSHVPAYTKARVISVKNMPAQRMSYQVWRFIEAKVSYTDKGLPVTGVYKVGTANYYGMNDAMI